MIADTIELEQPAPLTDANIKRWQRASNKTTTSLRKLVLAYVGAGAYVMDGAVAIYRRGERLLASAEKRGAMMEQGARRRFGNLEEQAVGEIRKLQEQAEDSVQHVRESRGAVNEEIEKRVELMLANMGLPSRERLERLNHEIDALNQKLDAQILRQPSTSVADPLR